MARSNVVPISSFVPPVYERPWKQDNFISCAVLVMQLRLSKHAKAVYLSVLIRLWKTRNQERQGLTAATLARLGKETGLSIGAVKRGLIELSDSGLLKYKRSVGGGTFLIDGDCLEEGTVAKLSEPSRDHDDIWAMLSTAEDIRKYIHQ